MGFYYVSLFLFITYLISVIGLSGAVVYVSLRPGTGSPYNYYRRLIIQTPVLEMVLRISLFPLVVGYDTAMRYTHNFHKTNKRQGPPNAY
jgi:hypothetical protein